MQQLSRMLTRLTLETRIHHASIDAKLLGPLETPSRSLYRRFLCLVYGFEAPLEAALAMAPGIELAFIQSRIKSGRIALDLLALGLTTQEFGLLAKRHRVPSFQTAAEALGWLYVSERTTLNHEMVRRRLLEDLPYEMEHAGSYLASYEGVVGERWRELGALLDRVAHDEASAQQVIDAAWDGLESQFAWLGEHDATTMWVEPLAAS